MYEISNEGLKAIRKMVLVRSVPTILVILSVLLVIGVTIANSNAPDPDPGPMPDMFLWFVPVMVVLLTGNANFLTNH
jgi:hypothetical protein